MTAKEAIPVLVRGRLEEAAEALADAELLLKEGRSARGVINCAYYAAFYAVQALLEFRRIRARKHSGALEMFDVHFMKTGVFPKAMSKTVRDAFDLRMANDNQLVTASPVAQAEATLQGCREFVAAVRAWLTAQGALDNSGANPPQGG
jgi:uncharacterized protein (UPF0332 family)